MLCFPILFGCDGEVKWSGVGAVIRFFEHAYNRPTDQLLNFEGWQWSTAGNINRLIQEQVWFDKWKNWPLSDFCNIVVDANINETPQPPAQSPINLDQKTFRNFCETWFT